MLISQWVSQDMYDNIILKLCRLWNTLEIMWAVYFQVGVRCIRNYEFVINTLGAMVGGTQRVGSLNNGWKNRVRNTMVWQNVKYMSNIIFNHYFFVGQLVPLLYFYHPDFLLFEWIFLKYSFIQTFPDNYKHDKKNQRNWSSHFVVYPEQKKVSSFYSIYWWLII